MIGFAFLLMAAQAAMPAPPPAPKGDVGFDIRCMIASQAATEKAEGAGKAAVQLAAMFYFGRVDSVLSGAALEQRMATEGEKLEGQPLGPIIMQCGQYMQDRGKALQAIGARLESRENAKQIR